MDAPFAHLLTTVEELRTHYREPWRSAWVTTDPDVLGRWDDELARPKTAIGVEVQHAFIHCAKSFRRGRVWDPSSWTELAGAPDACALLVAHIGLDASAADVRASLEEGYAADLAAEAVTAHRG